jgi:hypothetical protein
MARQSAGCSTRFGTAETSAEQSEQVHDHTNLRSPTADPSWSVCNNPLDKTISLRDTGVSLRDTGVTNALDKPYARAKNLNLKKTEIAAAKEGDNLKEEAEEAKAVAVAAKAVHS